MTDLSRRVSGLSPEKRALLTMMQQQRRDLTHSPHNMITRRGLARTALSYAQEGLWVVDQLEPGSPLYNIPAAVRITGLLDVPVLERSLSEVTARHDILRTIYATETNGQVVQLVAPKQAVALAVVDLAQMDVSERERRARELAAQEARRPFDLMRGPLMRVSLFRLDAQDHLLVFCLHHSIADGWSLRILTQEIAALYQAFSEGRPSPLPELPAQYADYAAWQRERLNGPALQPLLDYWLSNLRGATHGVKLPRDRQSDHERFGRGELCSFDLSPQVVGRLQEFCKLEGTTPFAVLLTVFNVLLYGQTGQDDVIVGCPVANRSQVEIENLIGYFTNSLVLRTDLSGNPSFRQLTAKVREGVMGAFEHQEMPFELLLPALRKEGIGVQGPLVRVAFAYDDGGPSRLERAGLSLLLEPLHTDTAKLDVLLTVHRTDRGLTATFEYNADLFEPATLQRLAQGFSALLEAALTDPARQLDSLLGPLKRPIRAEPPVSNLTRSQLLFWMSQKIHPEIPLHNSNASFAISGAVDEEHFRRAFQALVDQVDILRIVIEEVDGVPYQRALPQWTHLVELHDLSTSTDPLGTYEEWLKDRCDTLFDLGLPLFDTALVKIAPEEYRWYVSFHHMLVDKRSVVLLFERLGNLYQASLQGRLAAELPPAVQFADYAAYEQKHMRSELGKLSEEYWKTVLAQETEAVHFYGRPAINHASNVVSIRYELGEERTRGLIELAENPRLASLSPDFTLYQLFMATLFAYVQRVTGSRWLSVGTTFQTRPTRTFNETIGLFMEACPIRVYVEPGDTFASLAEKVGTTSLEALAHLPCGVPNPDNKTYDVLLNYHPHLAFKDFAGMPVKHRWIHPGHGADSLNVQVDFLQDRQSFVLLFDFNTDVFTENDQQDAIQHFITMLDAVLADPMGTIGQVELVSAAQAQVQLVDFNQTERTLPQHETVHSLFEAQALRTPDRVAVRNGDQRLTYRELNTKANQLAHHLVKLGLEPGTRAAISLPRTHELLVAIFAVLKAGCAYVPVDLSLPPERAAYIIQDSSAMVLVTNHDGANAFQEIAPMVVCLDDAVEALSPENGENPSSGVTPDHPLYVIYTSGSTGRPKGAGVYHRGFVNLLMWYLDMFPLSEADRSLIISSFSFDLTQKNLYAPLLVGGEVQFPPVGAYDPAAIRRAVAEGGTTLINCASSAFYPLVDDATDAELRQMATLRNVVLGGEPLAVARLVPWARSPHFQASIYNTYGPTECTDVVSWYRLEALERYLDAPVPIGRPIHNTQLLVLDENQMLVPIGVVGELCVAGAGVGMGYIGAPESTAAQFVVHPYGKPGQRLYRTGDLARWRSDGELEFFGRRDDRVKVRGFRVELSEIEAALAQQPDVRDIAIALRAGTGGEGQLVAYVVPAQDADPSADELRSFLLTKLPEYMVPSLYVFLDSLPKTPSGKIDRRALPAPAPQQQTSAVKVEPRTETEQLLAAIWASVLQLPAVSVDENFFNLGGDSILGLQVIARARQAGLELTPAQLFEYPTIAQLAAVAGTTQAVQQEQGAVTGHAPLLPIQQSYLVRDPHDAHYFNQSLLLELRESLEADILQRCLGHLVAYHDALRSRFRRTPSGWEQEIAAPDGTVPFERIDLSDRPDAALSGAIEAAAAERQNKFNLAEGGLFRAALFDCGPRRPARLLLVAHHLVVDAVSWRILLQDMYMAYRQLARGEAVQWPAKTASVKDWAERLTAHTQTGGFETDAGYWLSHGSRRVPPVPHDVAGGKNTVASQQMVSVQLDTATTKSLIEAGGVYRTRIHEMLLTALAQAVTAWTGARSVWLAVEGHGREGFAGVDLSRTVGWFTSLYPVHLELPERGRIGQALVAVKEQLRLVPSRGISHGALRYLARDDIARRLSAQPEPEIAFNYLGQVESGWPEGMPFTPAREAVGPVRSPGAERPYLIDVVGSITEGMLRFQWIYSDQVHNRETVIALADRYIQLLKELVAHCLSGEAGGLTPSDFPLVKLSQGELNRLISLDRQPEDIYPLSPLQQGMLFASLYEPESGAYFNQLVCGVEGVVDTAALRHSWAFLLARHSVLRSSFHWDGLAQAVQMIHQHVEMPVEEMDWRGLTEAQRTEQLEALLRKAPQQGFDLKVAPLMGLTLIQRTDQTFWLVWRFHHLLLDGWCQSLMMRDLFTAYEAFVAGRELPLEPAGRYRDYIAWLQRQDMERARTYWSSELTGFTPMPPVGSQPPAGNAAGTARGYLEQELALGESQTAALVSLVRTHQVTLNTLVQVVWALWLSRVTRRQEVVFGAPVSGRPADLPGSDTIMGSFINTLPVRVRLPEADQLWDWMREVQAQQAAARQFEYTSLVDIQTWSGMPKGQPLFESIVVFENFPVDRSLSGVSESLGIREVRAIVANNLPLTFRIVPGDRLRLALLYATDRFDTPDAERILRQVMTLLERIAAQPETTIAEMSDWLDEDDRQHRLGREQALQAASGQLLRRVRRREGAAE